MQNKITGHSDFEAKIFNNPINLLKAIKEHSLNYQESRYKMLVILDSLRTFSNTRQKELEPLQEYTAEKIQNSLGYHGVTQRRSPHINQVYTVITRISNRQKKIPK